MEIRKKEKVFFTIGDMVRLKQPIPYKPDMMVQSIDKSTFGDKPALLGVTCVWFTTHGELQKYRFNTKDLELI